MDEILGNSRTDKKRGEEKMTKKERISTKIRAALTSNPTATSLLEYSTIPIAFSTILRPRHLANVRRRYHPPVPRPRAVESPFCNSFTGTSLSFNSFILRSSEYPPASTFCPSYPPLSSNLGVNTGDAVGACV